MVPDRLQSHEKRILVLGAGFGGLELSTKRSAAFGDGVDVPLLDKSDAFTFGYSKLDVMFGRRPTQCDCRIRKSLSPAYACSRRRSRRSIPSPGASRLIAEPMRRISWWSRWAPTTIL